MTQAITTRPQATPSEISAETLEALVVGGDLAKLTPAQRLEVYQARCAAAGLDPRTHPFQYITLQNKLTLYATKAATDQLIAINRLTVEIVSREILGDLGVIEARARVRFPDGHTVEDIGVVALPSGKGEIAANALMKAITKAKRRTVLSACGLGALDESEIETIPGAVYVPVDASTGEIKDHPLVTSEPQKWTASPAQRKRLFAIAKESGFSDAELKALMVSQFNVQSTADLTREQYDQLCDETLPAFATPVDAEIVEG